MAAAMIRAGADIRAALERASDRVLLHDMMGATRTGHEILANVDRIAGALLAKGAARSKIGLWYRNNVSAVEAFLAVEWIGGTRVPVDPHAPPAEARGVFKAAGVSLVLADSTLGKLLGEDALIHDNDAPLAGKPVWPDATVLPDQTLLLYPRAVNSGELFAIPVSYSNWRATMRTNIALYQSGHMGAWRGDEECFLAAQQIMHGTGFVGTFPFLEMGLPQVLLDSFDASRALYVIERHRVTTSVLVPPMMSRLVDAALQRKDAARSLRHITYGGAAVVPQEIRRAMSCFGPVLVQGYGRIEGGWPISLLGIDDHRAIFEGDDDLAASCGRPIDAMRVRLRPVDGASRGVGELCVASDMTVKDCSDPDGWCSLGDLMHVDAKGYLFHRGRSDRMINTGYHIYPAEVEEAILQIPGVALARVSGVPSDASATMLVADLVLTERAMGADVTARLNQALAKRLAKYKIPRQFRIVEKLPD
jgi:acyl-CoA synthetase (AMP-forming)/AMP-acid ligase II